MRKLFLILAIFLTIIHSYAQPEKRVKAEVKSATVFLQKAQVTCEVRTEVEAGTTKIVVSGVPGDLKTEEIQVRGKGDGIIAGVNFRSRGLDSPFKPKEIVALEDSIEHLRFEIDSISQMEEILRAEEQMIYANKDIKSTEKGVKAHDLDDVADLYRERLVGLRGIIIRNKTKREKLQKKSEKLNNKIYGYSKTHGEIVITVNANSKSPIVLEIDYLVNDAGWKPVYDLKAKSIKDPINLLYKAFVYQSSRINWDNIKLTLSSGNANSGAYKPVLSKWNLNLEYQVLRSYDKKSSREMAAPSSTSMSKSDAKAEEMDVELEMVSMENFTEETQKAFAIDYEISIPYTIVSDGSPQLVEIKSTYTSPEFKHIAIPKTEKDPIVLAILTDWEKLNLLAGKANIYFSGAYIGSTSIDPNSMADTLEIPIIKDKKVIVNREKIKEFTSKKFIGTNIKHEYGYIITIRNTNKEAINLTLEDQIPVSQDSQIEVEFVNDSNAKFDPISGKLSWDFHIDPTETKKVIFKFAVKYPKDKIVNGL